MSIFTQEQGLAFVQYETDGNTANFPLTFEYLEREHVRVFVGVDQVTFTWLNASEVTPDVQPSAGDIVTIRRFTPNTERLVDYQDGGQISEKLLDKDSTQLLYISQEAFDTTQFNLSSNPLLFVVDFRGNRGINVADPVDDTDVVNKRHIQGLQTSVDAAAASAAASLAAAQDAQDAAEAIEGLAQSAVDTADAALTVASTNQPLSEKGQIDGYASLDSNGKVPAGQLPSFVDDVLEFADLASFPAEGEGGKIYVAIDSSKAYRWSGSVYTEISPSEVNSVNGQTGTVVLDKSDVGLSEVDNTSDDTKNSATAELTNKSLISPNRVDAKKDTLANLVTYADTTGMDGEICFATDVGSYFGIKEGQLVELGGASAGTSILVDGSFEQGLQGTCTDCTLATETVDVMLTPKNLKALKITVDDADASYELPLLVDDIPVGTPYYFNLWIKTDLLTVDVCEKVNGVERNCQEIAGSGKWIPVYFMGLTGTTSSILVKTGAATSGAVFLDLVDAQLGVPKIGPSKNCANELDCENTFEAQLSDGSPVVVSGEKIDWITGNCARTATGVYTCATNAFTERPNCTCSVTDNATINGSCSYSLASTATSLVFGIRNQQSNAAANFPISISCAKTGADYKPITDRGVVVTGQAQGALLVVTNEGTTSNVTIGNATITVPFDTVKPVSKLINWASNEATLTQSGKYELTAMLPISNSSGAADFFFYPEIDTGSGYAAYTEDNSECTATTGGSSDRLHASCVFSMSLQRGNKIRLRARSGAANSIIYNSGGRYPRLQIRSVLDQQTIMGDLETRYSTIPSASGLHANVRGGVEEQTADKWDGKVIYRRCYEVTANITATTTLHTIGANLDPVNAASIARSFTSRFYIDFTAVSGSNAGELFYDRSAGTIQYNVVSTTFALNDGYRFCLKYTK
jgi:hypothetical protein